MALGGGFARGLAHIGVLKVLEEEGIPVSFVSGTSVGALIGAAYCDGMTPRELAEISGRVRFKDFARYTLSRYGFYSNDRMTDFLEKLLKARTFEELRIPLAVSATDLMTGEAVVLRSGGLIEAVRASCAYPGMFLPVRVDGRLLMDGLLAHSVPARPAREMGAERVIAVYLKAHWVNEAGPRHFFEVIGQCLSIAGTRMCTVWEPYADVILRPEVNGFAYDSFTRVEELVRLGEEAARTALPVIRGWLGQPPAEKQSAKKKEKVPAAGLAPSGTQPA